MVSLVMRYIIGRPLWWRRPRALGHGMSWYTKVEFWVIVECNGGMFVSFFVAFCLCRRVLECRSFWQQSRSQVSFLQFNGSKFTCHGFRPIAHYCVAIQANTVWFGFDYPSCFNCLSCLLVNIWCHKFLTPRCICSTATSFDKVLNMTKLLNTMLSNLGATSGGGVLGGGTQRKLIVGLGSFGFVSFLLCFLGC